MRLLIDHTTVHALNPARSDIDYWQAVRGVLQFVEELCLASAIRISGAEAGRTIEVSHEIRDLLEHYGVTASSGEALVQSRSVNDEDFRKVIEAAADRLYETIAALELQGDAIAKLRLAGQTPVANIRASVDSAQSFPATVEGIEWDSEDRANHATAALHDKQLGSSAAMLLLNRSLFDWAKALVRQRPDPADPVYLQLHVMCRWHINMQLAKAFTTPAEDLQYAPAYDRAVALGRAFLPAAAAKLHFLDQKLWEVVVTRKAAEPGAYRDFSAASLPLPVIGAAVVLSLPEHASVGDLAKAIADLRADPVGASLRDLVSDRRSALDINALAIALRRKLRISPPESWNTKARITFMTLPPFVKGEIVTEKELQHVAEVGLRDVFNYLYSKPDVSVLTTFLEPVINEPRIADAIAMRVRRMLRLTA